MTADDIWLWAPAALLMAAVLIGVLWWSRPKTADTEPTEPDPAEARQARIKAWAKDIVHNRQEEPYPAEDPTPDPNERIDLKWQPPYEAFSKDFKHQERGDAVEAKGRDKSHEKGKKRRRKAPVGGRRKQSAGGDRKRSAGHPGGKRRRKAAR
jgi:hypothetical protein